MVLTVQTTTKPAVTITRTATKASELVYIAVANKAIKYPSGKSRIVYIGTTKNGAERIAASAAAKAAQMLGLHGVKHLELYVVTSTSMAGVKTWHKLERGLILAFKEHFGEPPKCNIVGKKMRWTDELTYFTKGRLGGVISKYST
ncbi:MAG: hypothetical protein RIR18_2048 [Pseudomonadota bacterium]|jgi:hypothetical protein